MDITQRRHFLIEDLSVARGERVVFGGVSLRLDSGEIAELTGPNGVGKSTLLRAIAGFLPLRSGCMSWAESEATDLAPLAERLHYVGHLDGLKSALTARENLEIGVGILGARSANPVRGAGPYGVGPRSRSACRLSLRGATSPYRIGPTPDCRSPSMAARRAANRARPARTRLAEGYCRRPSRKRRIDARRDPRTTRSAGDNPSQARSEVRGVPLGRGRHPRSRRGRERRSLAPLPVSRERSRRDGDAGRGP